MKSCVPSTSAFTCVSKSEGICIAGMVRKGDEQSEWNVILEAFTLTFIFSVLAFIFVYEIVL